MFEKILNHIHNLTSSINLDVLRNTQQVEIARSAVVGRALHSMEMQMSATVSPAGE